MNTDRSSSLTGQIGADRGCGPLIAPDRLSQRPLRQQIFERVRAEGLIPRVQISRDLDISPASVTTLTSELIERGLLEEVAIPRTDSGRGRPPVALGVCPGAGRVAGIKLSDYMHTAVIVDLAGNTLAEDSMDVRPEAVTMEKLCEDTERLLDRTLAKGGLARGDLSAVGIGLPGFVDHASGRAYWSPVLQGRDTDVAAAMSAHLELPVTVDNDANLVALAELWFGAGRDRAGFAVVTIEHGLGMGFVTGHRLYRGARGLGMELGHTKVRLDGALCRCGQRGCLEAYVADYALAREAVTAMNWQGGDDRSARELLETLFEHARAGDSTARSIFGRAGRYLAVGLANVVNLFDPELIILSGERMRYDYLYAEETLAELDRLIVNTGREAPPIKVQAWGDLLWAYGAGALALSLVSERLFHPVEDGS